MLDLISRRTILTAPFAAAMPTDAGPRAWEGIFVIMQTPFLETLHIDEESLRRETDFLARARLHGVVWPAGAGETTSLWYKERLKFSEAVVKEAKGRTTVLIGADGIHALGPSNGTADQEILTDYFTAIASASKLPLSIQVSTAGMSTDFLLRLADKLPTLRILKLEGGNVPHDVSRVVRERKRTLVPSTGGGAMNLMNEMDRGSGGTMAGAGFADIQAEIWDLFHAGKKAEAHSLFMKFLLSAVLERRTGYVIQKEVLRRRGIFKTVTMRSASRFSMDAADLKELDQIMEMLRPHFRV
jgi:4-hydroxy-tetrahydrodipicolinate synthase